MKLNQRGEIATLLTIAVLLVIGATTFVSSLVLKDKKTTSTQAVSQQNNCSVGIETIGERQIILDTECVVQKSDGQFFRCENGSLKQDLNDNCKLPDFKENDYLFVNYALAQADPDNFSSLIKSTDAQKPSAKKPSPSSSPFNEQIAPTLAACADEINPSLCQKNCKIPNKCVTYGNSIFKRWCCPPNTTPQPTPTPTTISDRPRDLEKDSDTEVTTTTKQKQLGFNLIAPTPLSCNTISDKNFYTVPFVSFKDDSGLQPCGVNMLIDERKVLGKQYYIYRECPTSTNNGCLYSCFENDKPLKCPKIDLEDNSQKHSLRIYNSSNETIYLTNIVVEKRFGPNGLDYHLESKPVIYCDSTCVQDFSQIKQSATKVNSGETFFYEIDDSISCPTNILPKFEWGQWGSGGVNFFSIKATIAYYKESSQTNSKKPISETPLDNNDDCYLGSKIHFTIK